MVDRNLIRSLEDDTLTSELDDLFPDPVENPALDEALSTEGDFDVNNIVEGRVLRVDDESVLIDVGFKSEATVGVDEWEEDEPPPEPGQMVKVLIEEVEDEFGLADDPHGMVSISKRKAEKILKWQKMIETVQEGEVVTGTVTRKIKGAILRG